MVLADTTRDWLEDAPRRGLILQHPVLAGIRLEQAGGKVKLPIYRLPNARIADLEELCALPG